MWPINLAEAGLGSAAAADDKSGRYVQSIDVLANGTIQIVYGRDANSRIQGAQLAIQPYVNDNGDVVWRCGLSNAVSDTYINSGGIGGGGNDSVAGTTDLSDKHMPASCRSGFGGGS
jgi:hypothetical protein